MKALFLIFTVLLVSCGQEEQVLPEREFEVVHEGVTVSGYVRVVSQMTVEDAKERVMLAIVLSPPLIFRRPLDFLHLALCSLFSPLLLCI